MILVDSNVPMYLVGAEHPHKVDARRLLERAIAENRPAYRLEIVPEEVGDLAAVIAELGLIIDLPEDVDLDIVERARDIVIGHPELTARDGVHLAVMRENGIEEILSFNRHFDGLPGIVRLS